MNICFNGDFLPADAPVVTASNRSFKWGDGLFETMKVHQGKLLLGEMHFERLFLSLQLLEIRTTSGFTREILQRLIIALCQQNSCVNSARIRLAVYRTDDNHTGYIIQAIPLAPDVNQWKEEGLVLGLYPHARKAFDAFANIKSASYLPYVLAQRFADANGLDDAIVLNAFNLVCDTSRANVFLIKNGSLHTPALHQGCVNGVMRRLVIDKVKQLGYRVYQAEISEEQLLQADEIFLTNAIQMIRWVKTYKGREYKHDTTRKIFDWIAATIFLPE